MSINDRDFNSRAHLVQRAARPLRMLALVDSKSVGRDLPGLEMQVLLYRIYLQVLRILVEF